MADQDRDRFKRVDTALDSVREEFNEALEESKAAGSKAAAEVREALDDLEERVDRLRKRDRE